MVDHSFREKIQKEAQEKYLELPKSILNLAPRSGKTKISCDIAKTLNITNILIVAPRKEIFDVWKQEFIKWDLNINVEFSTTRSIKNIEVSKRGLVVFDEINEYSLNELEALTPLLIINDYVLALSGTITKKTEETIYKILNLKISYKYTIEQGVKDGILADYEIFIHKVNLTSEEQKKYNSYIYLQKKARLSKKPTYFWDLKIITLLQSSKSKLLKTQEIIEQNKSKRLIAFSGTTDIADSLSIPSYHSKNAESQLLQDFCNGDILHLSSVNLIKSGITIKPIDLCVINYLSGSPEMSAQKICRVLGFEFNKSLSTIHIVCSNTSFETTRLKSALDFFDDNKIKTLL